MWIMGWKLSYVEVGQYCANMKLDIDVGSALHMVIGAFLEGESKILADTAALEMYKSGLAQERLSRSNFDRASAFNVIRIHESTRNMLAAKNIQDEMSKVSAPEKRHQEYDRQAFGSEGPDFVKVKEDACHRCLPEVYKKADLVKCFLT